ncbi:hypothetical protein EIN_381300 [Entamoeba invadens IP1]|uniref:Uncharacterized protein n=1 Tax=Entamoeba invadens IP1 TaxID=370355 RepID=A0A0A1UAQ7_ENTIV|nr:hypothetical protein EIN_381300 [Entamoeba invadens IP1]ELP92163.1 hypothetical protein EIN_381300 [Entamoeba invadens IP1]|eukprot:XP_004258934.1 hypothetical protein EIN_381300 [Entamoeba invadens IP1]
MDLITNFLGDFVSKQKTVQPQSMLSESNRRAIDWSYGVIAFGTRTSIIVVDPKNSTVINLLSHHIEDVTALKFQSNFPTEEPYSKRPSKLVSGDYAGNIILWDYFVNVPLITFTNTHNSPVTCIQWHHSSPNIFLALYAKGSITFYDTNTGLPVRNIAQNFLQNAFYFEQDPYDSDQIAAATRDNVFLLSTKQVTATEIYSTPDVVKSSKQDKLVVRSIKFAKSPQRLFVLSSTELVVFDTVLAQAIGSLGLLPPPLNFSFSTDETTMNVFSENHTLSQYRIDLNNLSFDTPAIAVLTKVLPPLFHLIRDPMSNDICLQLENGSLGILHGDKSSFNTSLSDTSFSCQSSTLTTYNENTLCVGTENGDVFFMDVDSQKISVTNVQSIGCPVLGITTAPDAIFVYGVVSHPKTSHSGDFFENRVVRFSSKRENSVFPNDLFTSNKEKLCDVVISTNGAIVVFQFSTKLQFWENKSDNKSGPKRVLEISVSSTIAVKITQTESSFLCSRDKDILIVTLSKFEVNIRPIYTHPCKLRFLANLSQTAFVFVDVKNVVHFVTLSQLLRNNVETCDKRVILGEKIVNIRACPVEGNKLIALMTEKQNCYIYDYSSQAGYLRNDFNVFMQQRRLKTLSMCWVKGNIPVVLTHVRQIMTFSKELEKEANEGTLIATPLHLHTGLNFRKAMTLMFHGFFDDSSFSVTLRKYFNSTNIAENFDRRPICELSKWLESITMKNELILYKEIITKVDSSLNDLFIAVAELFKFPQYVQFWGYVKKYIMVFKLRDDAQKYQTIIKDESNHTNLQDVATTTRVKSIPHVIEIPHPPPGLYPELFINTSLIADTEEMRMEKYGLSMKDDTELSDIEKNIKLNELQLIFGRKSTIIGQYMDMLKKTQKIEYGLKAILLSLTTYPEELDKTIENVVNELLDTRREEEAVRVLENLGNYQSACQLMIQTGKVFEAVHASTIHMPLNKIMTIIYIPWIVQQIGKGHYVTAAINLMKIGGFIDAVRVLFYGKFVQLAALLADVILSEKIATFTTDVSFNMKTVVFESPKNYTTFGDICKDVYERYSQILEEQFAIKEVADFYKFKITLIK